jgi:hypothetical protein
MNTRQRSTLITACVLALFTLSAHADNTQQSKMKTCNADATAKSLTGDDRKAYMKTCLSAAPAAAAPATAAPTAKTLTPQQQKMKDCNASAKTQALAGSDRKTFMSTCLKGSPSSSTAAAPSTGAAPATK